MLSKYTEVKYHFLNDLVEAQSTYCASKYMETDRLTKGLPIKQLEDWQELCNVRTYWRSVGMSNLRKHLTIV